MKKRKTVGIPLLLASSMVGCVGKKSTPSIDLPQNEESLNQLCVDVEPQTAQILLNSEPMNANTCQDISGEVLLEVMELGYAAYAEKITTEGQGMISRKIVLKPAMEFRSGNLMPPPMPTLQELCVTVEPADAFVLINGRKVLSGSCVAVQPAVDIKIEAEGFEKHVELFAMPQDQNSVNHHVVLEASKSQLQQEP